MLLPAVLQDNQLTEFDDIVRSLRRKATDTELQAMLPHKQKVLAVDGSSGSSRIMVQQH